jgi:hypothetical protein
MKPTRDLGNFVLINGAVMVGVAIQHLIDDFLFIIPEEFGLSNMQAQVLAGIFSVMLVAIFSLVARWRRWGYRGTAFLGGFVALAGILKHIPLILRPGTHWSGLSSEILIGVLILS